MLNENLTLNSSANLTLNILTGPTNIQEIITQPYEFISFKTLIVVIILLLYTIANPIFVKFNCFIMHESGVCMILGALINLVAIMINPDEDFAGELYFNEELFFNLILPPIIFAAGYNLKKKLFLKNFSYILILGLIGTFVSFFFYSTTLFILNEYKDMYSSDGTFVLFSTRELLLFAAVISSTDTIAAVTFIKQDLEPRLYSILFGEGIVNDAIAILLFQMTDIFTKTSKTEFKLEDYGSIVTKFLSLTFSSILLGILFGLLCSYFLKLLKALSIKLNRVQECSVIVFFAFISYSVTNLLDLSPIIALLLSGVVMSHYAYFNLSFQAREESSVVTKILENIAEAFVFTYLGLSSVSFFRNNLCFEFILWELVFLVIGRFFMVYGTALFFQYLCCCCFKFDLTGREKAICSLAGSIRGVIAFGLSMSIKTDDLLNKQILVSSMLVICFVTTISFGALLPLTIRCLREKEPDKDDYYLLLEKNDIEAVEDFETDFKYYHPNNLNESTRTDIIIKNSKKEGESCRTIWKKFDTYIMKPLFIFESFETKAEHDDLTDLIKNIIYDYRRRKRIEAGLTASPLKVKKHKKKAIKEMNLDEVNSDEENISDDEESEQVRFSSSFSPEANLGRRKSKTKKPSIKDEVKINLKTAYGLLDETELAIIKKSSSNPLSIPDYKKSAKTQPTETRDVEKYDKEKE